MIRAENVSVTRGAASWTPDTLSRYRAVLPQHSALAFDFAVDEVVAQIWPDPATPGTAGALLLDEPVASLDPQYQHRTLQIARAMAASRSAVLVVLYDLNLAVQYADRIALLCRGQLAAVGPAHTVLDAGQLSAVYGTGFDIIDHPCADCPLVLPRPASRGSLTHAGVNFRDGVQWRAAHFARSPMLNCR